MGKVHLSSDMSVEEVECEIRSVFKTPMGNDTAFPVICKSIVLPSGDD